MVQLMAVALWTQLLSPQEQRWNAVRAHACKPGIRGAETESQVLGQPGL